MTNSSSSATLLIIRYLLTIDNYNKYNKYIDKENISKIEVMLYRYLDELIVKFGKDISVEEFCLYVLSRCEDKDVYEPILTALSRVILDPAVVHEVIENSRQRKEAHKLALLAIDVSEGKKDFQSLRAAFDAVDEEPVMEEEVDFITDDLEILYEEKFLKPGLRWRLGTLNKMFGSLREGDFGFIFARPETGKTTFLTSEETYFAEQAKERGLGPVVHFNNEEDGKKVRIRQYQAALGLTLPELFHDRDRWQREYRERVGSHLLLYDQPIITRMEVEAICAKVQPSCIIFDQLDAVEGFAGDRDDLRLGAVYKWARTLAKTYGPTIGVCQADGSGEGKKWLTMENVALAKTAKQAEADWILGIGCIHDDGYDQVRFLHASKNKLQGDQDTVPALRHGKQEVIIQPQIARYEDYKR